MIFLIEFQYISIFWKAFVQFILFQNRISFDFKLYKSGIQISIKLFIFPLCFNILDNFQIFSFNIDDTYNSNNLKSFIIQLK